MSMAIKFPGEDKEKSMAQYVACINIMEYPLYISYRLPDAQGTNLLKLAIDERYQEIIPKHRKRRATVGDMDSDLRRDDNQIFACGYFTPY